MAAWFWVATVAAAEPVHIGVLAYRSVPETLAQWQPLQAALNEAIPEHVFRFEAMSYPELEAAVASRRLDFVLTNSAHYVLLARRFGLSAPLATQINIVQGREVSVFGGVILVRADHQEIQTLADAADAKIGYVAPDSLGGFQMQAYELAQAGLALPAGRLRAFGTPHVRVIDAVLSGEVDVGFVRSGLIESLTLEGRLAPGALRVINPADLPDLPFQVSTGLYPEWPFASTPHTSPELSRRVLSVLLGLKDQPDWVGEMGVAGFSVPADYSVVADLLLELRVPPFDFVPEVTVVDIWRQFQREILVLLALVALILAMLGALLLNRRRLRRLQTIIEHSPVVALSWLNQPGWPVAYISKNIHSFGYEPEQLFSGVLHFDALIHPEDLPAVSAEVAKHFAHGPDQYRQSYRLRHGDGRWLWVDDYSWLTRNRQGQVTQINGILSDVTARCEAQRRLAHSRQLMHYVIEHNRYAVAVHDRDLNYVFVSKKYLESFKLAGQSLIGRNHYEVFPNLPQALRDAHQRVLGGEVLRGEDDLFLHIDGSEDWTRWECRPWFEGDGQIGGLIVYTEITTERKQAELALKERTEALASSNARLEQLAAVFTFAREGIIISDAEGLIIEVNQAFTRITGYSRSEALGRNPRLLRSGRHEPAFYKALWGRLVAEGYWSGEIWNRRKNGEIYPQSITISAVRSDCGDILQYVALFSDVSEERQNERQLQYVAQYDPLTGLPNRSLLTDRLRRGMAHCDRHQVAMAVVYLDLDAFKTINDRFGHDAGDRLLCELAQRLKANLRDGDTAARLGGDELVVLLLDLDSPEAVVPMLEQLLDLTNAAFRQQSAEISLSASLGVTFYPQHEAVEPDQLLRQADQAMYKAKIAGKNRYHLFNMEEDLATRGMHESLQRVRCGIDQGEFRLHYQPKVNMRTGEVLGAEALIRWQHPERGLLSPAQFLPLVENDDLALDLGQWVIEDALRQLAAWQREGLTLTVSVNVFGRQLQRLDFVETLQRLMGNHPEIGPGQLEIEVLETSALEDIGRISGIIAACEALGVRCSLDDFGTGYSSLTYLKRLPASILKIDQSFVRDMLDDPEDLAILNGILGLAQSFQRECVAEGVETVAHGEILLDLGCDMAQGYGIARPMPAEQLRAWIAAWQPSPSWLNRRIKGSEERRLIFAIVEHRAWISALLGHVRDGLPLPEMDPHACPFGHWLDEQYRRFEQAPEFHDLVAVHAELHQQAHAILALGADGDRSAAGRELAGVVELRDQLIGLIKQLASTIFDPDHSASMERDN